MSEQKSTQHNYRLEVVSESPFFSDQNLYLCIASYEGDSDKPSDIAYNENYSSQPGVTATLQNNKPAERITIAIYTIPQQYPDKPEIAKNPPFSLTYRVYRDNQLLEEKICEVDRWGGLQVIGVPYK